MEENNKERMLQLAQQETWTKTPFSYVKTGKKLTLLQTDAMLMVSAHIQDYIRDFFDKGMNKSKEKPRSLFAQHLLENGIPPFRIYLAELGINTANYKVTRQAIEEHQRQPDDEYHLLARVQAFQGADDGRLLS